MHLISLHLFKDSMHTQILLQTPIISKEYNERYCQFGLLLYTMHSAQEMYTQSTICAYNRKLSKN